MGCKERRREEIMLSYEFRLIISGLILAKLCSMLKSYFRYFGLINSDFGGESMVAYFLIEPFIILLLWLIVDCGILCKI